MTSVDAQWTRIQDEIRRLEAEGARIVARLESPGYAPPGTTRRGIAFGLGLLLLGFGVALLAFRPGLAGALLFLVLGCFAWTLFRRAWRDTPDPLAARLDAINARLRALREEIRDLDGGDTSGA